MGRAPLIKRCDGGSVLPKIKEMIMKNRALSFTILLLALAGVIGVFSFNTVSGQEESAWNVRCNESWTEGEARRGKCEAFQRLTVQETQQRFLEIAIGFPAEGSDTARGVIIMPLGVLLSTGVLITVDEQKPFQVSPRYCDAGGCVAFLDMTQDVLDVFRGGNDATVTLYNNQGKKINLKTSLSGFTKALGDVS